MKTILAAAAWLGIGLAAWAQSVVAPGAQLQKLAGGFAFTEGPTCDAQGNLFFTDQPNDRILEWSVDGQLSTWMKPAGRANGMMFDAQGNLLVCAEAKNELWSVAPDKTVTVLANGFQGRDFNAPNDVWAAPDGSIYFTDPFYPRTWAAKGIYRVTGEKVYRLSPDRKELRVVIGDLKKPNGITGTPDGLHLYVADIRANKTWRYDIQSDGSLANKTLFCNKGSDGMTIDAEGNLYLCATGQTNGVSVFNSAGKLIEHIAVPEQWSANVCIGGPDHQTLFITASDSLYAIQLRVKGANAAK
jgi:gluconolactonase